MGKKVNCADMHSSTWSRFGPSALTLRTGKADDADLLHETIQICMVLRLPPMADEITTDIPVVCAPRFWGIQSEPDFIGMAQRPDRKSVGRTE